MGWGKAIAALLQLISRFLDLWREGKPKRDEAEKEESRQERRQAAMAGNADYVQRDIDRLLDKAKRRAAGKPGSPPESR